MSGCYKMFCNEIHNGHCLMIALFAFYALDQWQPPCLLWCKRKQNAGIIKGAVHKLRNHLSGRGGGCRPKDDEWWHDDTGGGGNKGLMTIYPLFNLRPAPNSKYISSVISNLDKSIWTEKILLQIINTSIIVNNVIITIPTCSFQPLELLWCSSW